MPSSASKKKAKLSGLAAVMADLSVTLDRAGLPALDSIRYDERATQPPIQTTATSNRVKEEKRNVRVKAFIYAASRENDNDFHLIIGRSPDLTPEMYMTMELSGLPASNSASFTKLKAARDAYKAFFA